MLKKAIIGILLAVLTSGLFIPANAAKTSTVTTYTVKKGDNLSKIAKKHKTTVSKLKTMNKIKNVNLIRIGQKIKVPKTTKPSLAKKPAPKTTKVASRTGTRPSITQTPAWQCKVSTGDSKLNPWVSKVRTRIDVQFDPRAIYGTRPGDRGDHGTGRALDVMVPLSSMKGDQVRDWTIKNNKKLNVDYVIWKQRIYGSWTGWKAKKMENRGNNTANHYDHVHVSFKKGSGTCPA